MGQPLAGMGQQLAQQPELNPRQVNIFTGAADATVDVQQMISDAADLGPDQHNTADSWSFTALDKGGFIGAPISEEEARARQDAEWRADIEEFNALARAGKREASGSNRQTSLAQRDH